jgi:hypothetical protein
MTMTTIEHKAPDRSITERILDPADKPATDLPGYLDQRLARLIGFSRGWPAVTYLQGLAAAMRLGEKQALAEVGHAASLTEVERWQAGQILRLWRREAPQAALGVLADVAAAWREAYGDDPAPPVQEAIPVTAGPDLYASPGRALSPGAEAIFGKPRGRRSAR